MPKRKASISGGRSYEEIGEYWDTHDAGDIVTGLRAAMAHHIFLSHDHRDDGVAKTLADLIGRLSLRQLEVWFSSDRSPRGGITAGDAWLDQIQSQLKASKAIIALLTARSLERPWLLFESGFGAGLGCAVIPVCIGLSPSFDVPSPFATYQAFHLTDLASLEDFAVKLLSRYDIPFDEDMMRPVLGKAVSAFTTSTVHSGGGKEKKRELSSYELLEVTKNHLDRRIGELLSAWGRQASPEIMSEPKERVALYGVPIFLGFKDLNVEQYITIDSDSTVQDILDRIYYMLETRVKPFTYLQTWILRERHSGLRLVVREVAHLIPASSIFRPGTYWEASALSRPHKITDSGDPFKWYRKPLFEEAE